jgi:DNA polymerase I
MKIPLSALALNDRLIINANGKEVSIDPPIKPFMMVQKDQFPDIQSNEVEIWTKVPENEKREYYRCSFENLDAYQDFRKRNVDRQKYMLANSFIEQIYISAPEFMKQYPHTQDLKIMFFDLEVASKGDGFFPKPISNEILCIGYSIWLYHNDGTKTKIKHKIIKGFDVNGIHFGQTTDGDKNILIEFRESVRSEDPDIIAGYNSEEFDFPYLMDRYNLLDIDMKGIGRNNKAPYIGDGDAGLRIPGRIHFDLYNSNAGVNKDQTLFGIKSRTLKEIARFYKAKRTIYKNEKWVEETMDDIEVPEHIENLLKLFKEDPDRLYSYQDDDISRTECVGHVYMRNCVTLAEMLGVPLSSIITMYSSFVPKLFIARSMETKRLINTESNFQKYNSNNGSIAQLGTRFEGALVGLYKDGYFPKVYKLDFSSMYPSSIQTWNLGPDTTSFVSKLPYTGKYTFKKDTKYNWYRIPDANFKCDILVKVRNDVEGLLKSEIGRLRAERVKIKKQLKSATESEKPALDSQQYAIKVILNSIYGLLGLKSSMYGDMISAMMVTSMCRWTTGNVIRKYSDNLVELDTDGLILDKEVSEKDTNKWLDELIDTKFGIKDNYMQMEMDDYGRAYFYAMKNYIVEEDGKYIIHGSSFKASRTAKIVDRAINLAIQHVFNGKPKDEVLDEALNFKKLTIEDFEERVKLSKEPREYEDPYDMRLYLAKQMEMKTGQVSTMGTQLNYVVTKRGLPFPELKPYIKTDGKNYTFVKWVDGVEDLDLKYYEELVLKALEKFKIKKKITT